MNQAAPITQDIQSARDHIIGKKIASFRIYGINSLKTLQPAPDALVGDQIVDLSVQEDVRNLVLVCGQHTVRADLARTGTLVMLKNAIPWSLSGGGPMPTARMIFDDGTGVDLREPAKTKRITFAIRRNGL